MTVSYQCVQFMVVMLYINWIIIKKVKWAYSEIFHYLMWPTINKVSISGCQEFLFMAILSFEGHCSGHSRVPPPSRLLQIISLVTEYCPFIKHLSVLENPSSTTMPRFIYIYIYIYIYFFFFKSQPPYQVEKNKDVGMPEVGVSDEGVCCKITFLWNFKMWSLKIRRSW